MGFPSGSEGSRTTSEGSRDVLNDEQRSQNIRPQRRQCYNSNLGYKTVQSKHNFLRAKGGNSQ